MGFTSSASIAAVPIDAMLSAATEEATGEADETADATAEAAGAVQDEGAVAQVAERVLL